MDDKKQRCDHCYSNWQWTMLALSKREVLQIGCFGCMSVYNVVEDEYKLIGQRSGHYIFWKDLHRQWDEALQHIADVSTAKKQAS